MSTSAAEAGRKPLAERLVQEALLLVAAAGGPNSLSLREVQRRANVSPAAAYRHFANRDDLLQAAAEEAAGLLADAVVGAVDGVDPDGRADPRARLLTGCEAYLDFATGNPGLYRTIFYSDESVEQLAAPTARSRGEAGDGGYNVLVRLLQAVVGVETMHPAEPIVVWSALHGLATLRLDAALRFVSTEQFGAIQDRVLRTVVAAAPLETLVHEAPDDGE